MRVRAGVSVVIVEQGEAFAQVFVLPGSLCVGAIESHQADGAIPTTRGSLGNPVGEQEGVPGGVQHARDGGAGDRFLVDFVDELLFCVDVAEHDHLELFGGANGFEQMGGVGTSTHFLVVVVHARGHMLQSSTLLLLFNVVLSTFVQ